ncbi:MAG: hypothetical protein OEZ38_14030, partial [Gammaproteobacteria bacterium]|nr:hypothetical protein [Gammaproteobacteria bacterium]
LLGRGMYARVVMSTNDDTGVTTFNFAVSQHSFLCYLAPINQPLNNESAGIAVTPLAVVQKGKNKGRVFLFIQVTKKLTDVLNPLKPAS